MTATLTFGPPATSPGRATFTALAARETRRLVLNPVFLFAVALIVFALWAGREARDHRDRDRQTRTRRSSSAGSA